MTRIKLQKSRFQPAKRSGMKLIKGATFHMGGVDFYDDEKPVRLAKVGDFWIDETPVTNAQFARFIAATGYISFAEVPQNPEDYPGMALNMAHPGSLLRSEEPTSELQSLMRNSYAAFGLKKT